MRVKRGALGLVLGLTGCGLTVESRPILDSRPIAAGAECQNGGERVLSGVDENGDGALSDDEVDGSTAVCFPPGQSGSAAVSATSSVGLTCSTVSVSVGGNSASACLPIPANAQTTLDQLSASDASQNTRLSSIEASVPMVLNQPNQTIVVRENPGVGEFATLDAALAFIAPMRITSFLNIVVQPGTYIHTSPIRIAHPNGAEIGIEGDSAATGEEVILRFVDSRGIFIESGAILGFLGGLTLEYEGATNPPCPASSGPCVGLEIRRSVFVEIAGITVRNFPGHQVLVRSAIVRSNAGLPLGVNNLNVTCSAEPSFRVGVMAEQGAVVDFSGSTATGCTFGFWALRNSFMLLDRSTADGNLTGFIADGGSTIEAEGAQASNNTERGFAAVNKGTMVMTGWEATGGPGSGNRVADVEVRDGSLFRSVAEASQPNLPNCGRVNVDRDSVVRGCSSTVTVSAR